MNDFEQLLNVSRERHQAKQGANPTTKQSSANVPPARPSSRLEKASAVQRVAARHADMLDSLATIGLMKVAMEQVAGGAEGDASTSGPSMSMSEAGAATRANESASPTPDTGMAAATARTDVNFETQPFDKGNISSSSPAPGLTGPNGNVVAHVTPTNTIGSDSTNEIDFQKESQILRAATIGKSVNQSVAAPLLKTAGIQNARDAIRVFVNTAKTLPGRLGVTEKLSSADIVALHDVSHPQRLAIMWDIAARAGQTKLSSMGLPPEIANQGALDEIAKATDAAAKIVKAQGTLPMASDLITVAGVSPEAANVAIQQTAELIAAVGGQVISPEAAAMGAAPAPTPGPLGAGGMAPAMGAMPGAAMMPPAPVPAPAGPPAMDPSMMGGMPAGDPSMMGGAPAGDPAQGGAAPAPAPAPAEGSAKTSGLILDPVKLRAMLKQSADSVDAEIQALDSELIPGTSPSHNVASPTNGGGDTSIGKSDAGTTPEAASTLASNASITSVSAQSLKDLEERHLDRTLANTGTEPSLGSVFASAATSNDQHIAREADLGVSGSLIPDNKATDAANGGTQMKSPESTPKQSSANTAEQLKQRLFATLQF